MSTFRLPVIIFPRLARGGFSPTVVLKLLPSQGPKDSVNVDVSCNGKCKFKEALF